MTKYYKLGDPTPIENVTCEVTGLIDNIGNSISHETKVNIYDTVTLIRKDKSGYDFFVAKDNNDTYPIIFIGKWIES